MDNQQNNNFQTICMANKEMLNYFNKAFLNDLEAIQALKTQSFEIDIKIDELEKTKSIYAFKSTSKKSVFTPVINDDADNQRGKIIEDQIHDLKEVKESLSGKIKSMEAAIYSTKNRLSILNDAEKALEELSANFSTHSSSDTYEEDGDFDFVEEGKSEQTPSHGYNILMQDAFDKAFLSTLLDKNVKDPITSINHKLEMLSYLLGTDISRAKVTLNEVIQNSKNIISSIDDINDKLNYNFNSAKPIWTQLDEFVMTQREAHPECIIEANIECTDYEINVHPVFTINLIKLLNIFFDNIFTHANANNIEFKLSISKNTIEASIIDNGVGINSNYLTQSPWYSNLHKAHEIIHLLEGRLNISGDIISGTSVRFNFPIQA